MFRNPNKKIQKTFPIVIQIANNSQQMEEYEIVFEKNWSIEETLHFFFYQHQNLQSSSLYLRVYNCINLLLTEGLNETSSFQLQIPNKSQIEDLSQQWKQTVEDKKQKKKKNKKNKMI
ncbi:hypothetical protein M0813_12696 [Anaeramoeba flamelloides]|uniref:Uncharacterized protein n=1 Tax=Anaeramoeba flamelloides TaxID=1746091 RepID=A0AAV7YHV2_9EUKA|nr:hypothetical protein M0812_24398 [Anaeramoeba flamelloides]KAJ6254138.1 hypothetical protein M0813_12696 [Anaeramoeba flamelloides]